VIGVAVSPSTAGASSTATRSCSSKALQLSVEQGGEASGSVVYLARLENISASGCILDGYPTVTIRYADGAIARSRPGVSWYLDPRPATPTRVEVPRGSFAQFAFGGQDWRPAANGGRGAACPIVGSLTIELPGEVSMPALPWPSEATWELCGPVAVAAVALPPAKPLSGGTWQSGVLIVRAE
jgi:Protein of unknown function (DUF4232)